MGEDFTSPKPRRREGAVKIRDFPSADGKKELPQAGSSRRSAVFRPHIETIVVSHRSYFAGMRASYSKLLLRLCRSLRIAE
jgi:hypothetical protein